MVMMCMSGSCIRAVEKGFFTKFGSEHLDFGEYMQKSAPGIILKLPEGRLFMERLALSAMHA